MTTAIIRTEFHGDWEHNPEVAVQFHAMLLLSRGYLSEARQLLDWYENNCTIPGGNHEPSRN